VGTYLRARGLKGVDLALAEEDGFLEKGGGHILNAFLPASKQAEW